MPSQDGPMEKRPGRNRANDSPWRAETGVTSRQARKQAISAYAMLAPVLVLFVVFIGLPMALAVVVAFKRVDMAQGLLASPWVGFQNFRDLFGSALVAERVHRSFYNTLLFTICFVPLNMLASLAIATLIHSVGKRGQTFYRAAFFLPSVTSAIVFAMIWKWLYDPNFGLLNHVLGYAGLGPINWTGDPNWAIWSVILAALAAGPGANILIYLAALGSVSEDLVEAAKVDGANPLVRWWNVTVPAIKHVTLYLIVLNTIGSFQVFELVFILTEGGPAGASTVIVYEIYSLAFTEGRYGLAGALSLILLGIVMIFTWTQFALFGKDSQETYAPGFAERVIGRINDGIGAVFVVVGDTIEVALRKIRQAVLPKRERTPQEMLEQYSRPPLISPAVWRSIPLHLFLFPLAFLLLFPMIWMFLSAFTPRIYLQTSPPEIALAHLSLENYLRLRDDAPNILRWFWNSLYISVVITGVQLMLSCLAGYVFARLTFPGRGIIFGVFIASIILPFQALIIPLFIVISSGFRNTLGIDVLDTHWAVMLPALSAPVGIFLMRQYIAGMPRELDEAARIDGCGDFTTWWMIILPLCKPVLGAWGILTFTAAWKNFFWPFVVLGSEGLFTLEVGLQSLQQQHTQDYGLVMAGATASAVPMIIVFFIFQKQIVRGLTFGAVKG